MTGERHCLMPCLLQRRGGVCECMLRERAETQRPWEKTPLIRLRRRRGDTGMLPRKEPS